MKGEPMKVKQVHIIVRGTKGEVKKAVFDESGNCVSGPGEEVQALVSTLGQHDPDDAGDQVTTAPAPAPTDPAPDPDVPVRTPPPAAA